MTELKIMRDALDIAVEELHLLFSQYTLSKSQWEIVFDFFSREPNQYPQWEVLKKAGATFRKPDRTSTGILWWALTACHWELMPRLVKLGADINEVSWDDPEKWCYPETALDHSSDEKHTALSDAQAEAREAIFKQIENLGGKFLSELEGGDA